LEPVRVESGRRLVDVGTVPEYPKESLVADVLAKRCQATGLPEEIADTDVFARRANADGVVVVTFVNGEEANDPLFTNLLCSWRRLAVANFVIVATDDVAAAALRSMSGDLVPEGTVHHDPAAWPGASSGQLRTSVTATDAYLRFIHLRTNFVKVLMHDQLDLHLVVTDADTVWLRDPLELVTTLGSDKCDMHIVDEANMAGRVAPFLMGQLLPQGGFIMLANTKLTRGILREWVRAAVLLSVKEQPALRTALTQHPHVTAWYPSDWDGPYEKPKKPTLCVLDAAFVLHTSFFVDSTVSSTVQTATDTIHAAVLLHPNIAKKTHKAKELRRKSGWFLDERSHCPLSLSLLPPLLPSRPLLPPWSPRGQGLLDFSAWLESPSGERERERESKSGPAGLRLGSLSPSPYLLPLSQVHPRTRSDVSN
jgi:hypothetical protein